MIAVLLILAACASTGDGATAASTDPVTTVSTIHVTSTAPSTTTTGIEETTDTTGFMDWVLSLETWPPITGYGDFSDVDLVDLDYYQITELIIQCAHDHGIPVHADPAGDGTLFNNVPAQQSRQAGI